MAMTMTIMKPIFPELSDMMIIVIITFINYDDDEDSENYYKNQDYVQYYVK